MARAYTAPAAPTSVSTKVDLISLATSSIEFLPNDVREDFGSYLYWTAELKA